jgi:hypothetical protein
MPEAKEIILRPLGFEFMCALPFARQQAKPESRRAKSGLSLSHAYLIG